VQAIKRDHANQDLRMVGQVWLRALRCRGTQKEQKPNPDCLLSVSRTNLQHPAEISRQAHDEAHVACGVLQAQVQPTDMRSFT